MTTILSRAMEGLPVRQIPLLRPGDRLSQPEFHRRYEAMPAGVKAELIGGIVYMPSPVGHEHGDPHFRLGCVLGNYEAATPGVRGSDNSTVILGEESEPQPDLHLRILPEYGGHVRPNADGYLVGPPELVIEVAHSSVSIDLHGKRDDYERAGTLEYLVLCIDEADLRSFDVPAGKERQVDTDGVYRSKVFPGLWIDVAAVLSGDTRRMLRVLNRGLKTAEHAAFVKRLKAKRPTGSRPGKSRPRGRRSNGTRRP